MKFALIFSLFSFSSFVFATGIEPSRIAQALQQNGVSSEGGSVPANGSTPVVGHALVTARIMKTTWSQDANGVFGSHHTEVCKKQVTIDVYDIRATPGGGVVGDHNMVDCDSTLQGTPVTVYAGGVMALYKVTDFGPAAAIKVAIPQLYVMNRGTSTIPSANLSAFSVLATRDLNAKSFLSQVSPWSELFCPSGSSSGQNTGTTACAPSISEYFVAYIEFGDAA